MSVMRIALVMRVQRLGGAEFCMAGASWASDFTVSGGRIRVHKTGADLALGEVEQRQRHSPPSVVVNPALRTLVATRRWWKVRGGRDAGQLVTFR